MRPGIRRRAKQLAVDRAVKREVRRTAEPASKPVGPRGGTAPNLPPPLRVLEDFDRLANGVMLGVRHVAEIANVGVATVNDWRRLGCGPKFVSVNGRPQTTVGWVREWQASLREETPPTD